MASCGQEGGGDSRGGVNAALGTATDVTEQLAGGRTGPDLVSFIGRITETAVP